MNIAVIGTQVIADLIAAGHEATGHSRSTGIDLLTGDGLADAVRGADVVVDVTNSPTFDEASLDFFRATVPNLQTAAHAAGVGHFVALSIVGVDQVPQLDYYRAKTLQEDLLAKGPTPYSIVRATQFFEFMDATMSWTSDDTTVRLPATRIQPMAAADVAAAVADAAVGTPLRGIRNVAGPEVFRLDRLGEITLAAHGDERSVVTDDTAGLFAVVQGDALIAGPDARLAPTRYQDWLAASR